MIPKTHELITFVIFFLQILSIVASTSGLSKTLYKGKDNPILLAYPARHFEVFLSKLLVFYIYEFFKSLFILLPLFFRIWLYLWDFKFCLYYFNFIYGSDVTTIPSFNWGCLNDANFVYYKAT